MESAGERHSRPEEENGPGAQLPVPPAPRDIDGDGNGDGDGARPPRFTVNLALPPARRYGHMVPQLQARIERADLQCVFDDLLEAVFPDAVAAGLRALARVALRRVYSAEETAELRGISRAAGIRMYLLVAFNVVLDLLFGCTSGGARVEEPDASGHEGISRILQYVTLFLFFFSFFLFLEGILRPGSVHGNSSGGVPT